MSAADKLVQVIAEHRDELLTVCSCGDWRPSSLRLTMAQARAEYEAHVAAVALAHLTAEGWAQGREEWGTRDRNGHIRSHFYRDTAERWAEIDGREVVRRRVTDWEAV